MTIFKNLLVIAFIKSVVSQAPPTSPFGLPKDICFQNVPFSVGGFPGSPHKITPFKDTFVNPPNAVPMNKVCREDGHCIVSYEFDVHEVQKRPFDKSTPSCRKFPGTWFLSYAGSIPGPTITMPTGHESLVRFNNKINHKTGYFKQSFSPCLENNGRSGRPFSVHFHGSASLAPYDGWAEDETCNGETKDYVYPNNRPNTGWYHDHALHITADNAYLGLAGLYLISSKQKHGGCGEPWNMENIEEKSMILSDKVLDDKCQLFADTFKAHKDDLYGDINLVSGIPFPNMPLEPKWYRFRLLNAAVSRPYLLKIKDAQNKDVSANICKVIAADGGYRNTPVAFPANGLLIGVAERYEIVCDFTNLKAKTLYFWNEYDDDMMKGVPYFCHSHLIAKIQVGVRVLKPALATAFVETLTTPEPVKPINKVMTQADLDTALQMANNGQSHRQFKFGRTNGHWTINGETWDTMKIAAEDVGQNTWELWEFNTGGGWFHPVHIHLIDFFVIKRIGAGNGVREYENMSPKDVFYLGPSNTIYVVARFGAHKGDYMFHCHNLIHEDNDMMRAFRVTHSHMGPNSVSANPFVLNPLNNIIYNNWKYADPMLGETNAKQSSLMPVFNQEYLTTTLNKNLYRIFYPLSSDVALMNGADNPWQSKWCPI